MRMAVNTTGAGQIGARDRQAETLVAATRTRHVVTDRLDLVQRDAGLFTRLTTHQVVVRLTGLVSNAGNQLQARGRGAPTEGSDTKLFDQQDFLTFRIVGQ